VIARANNLPEGVKGIISDYLVAVDTRVNPELLDWVMNEMVKVIPAPLADPTIARFMRGNLSQEIFEAQSKPNWLGIRKTDDDIKDEIRAESTESLNKKHQVIGVGVDIRRWRITYVITGSRSTPALY